MTPVPPRTPSPWPAGVSRPAQRALAAAGIASLEDLAGRSRADLAALHGMGPKALGLLEAALAERGFTPLAP